MDMTSVSSTVSGWAAAAYTGGYNTSLQFGNFLTTKVASLANTILASKGLTAFTGAVLGVLLFVAIVYTIHSVYRNYYPSAIITNTAATSTLNTNGAAA